MPGPRYKPVDGSFVTEIGGGTSGMTWRDRWLLICCCFLVLLVLGILGVVGFAKVLGLDSDLDTHRYCLDLTGCKELPHEGGDPPACAGDPNGAAWATITVETKGQDTVCVDILVGDLITLPVRGLHIHGPLDLTNAQVKGVFVDFGSSAAELGPFTQTGPDGVRIRRCVDVNNEKASEIIDSPHLFYLNVHNTPFPDGALRDQLGNGCRDDL